MNSRTLFFSVGEPSGDLHASKLITALQNREGGMLTRGLGGPKMREAGCHIDYELTNLAVVGIVEVLPKLREFFRVADQAEAIFREGKIDGVVLVDFPGFNWHIAKRAKKYGIPVFYYLPPQVWAWASWRIKKMKRYVDHVLCNLPFEPAWYEKRGLPVHYVGHPFFDEVQHKQLDERFIRQSKTESDMCIAILPGSRGHEVHHNWPLQLEVIRRLSRKYPKAKFMVASFKQSQCVWCQQQLTAEDRNLNIEFCVGKTSEIISMCEFAIMVSGSVSLELMARGTPGIVIYRVGRLLYTFGKLFVRIGSMTLPNLMAERKIMPEYLTTGNPDKTASAIVDEASRMIESPEYRYGKKQELLNLAQQYARPGATQRAADLIYSLLPNSEPSIPQPIRRAA